MACKIESKDRAMLKAAVSDRVKGCYLLLLRLPRAAEIKVGKRTLYFSSRYYVYCGSAQGGLRGRLKRHARPPRAGHWHIDRLLDRARIIDLQMRFTASREEECVLAREVGQWPLARPIPGFGATDCGCDSHLFQFPSRPLVSVRSQRIIPRLPEIFACLRNNYRNHALWERDPFQTLAGCILSLRTRDPVTEQAMKRLFAVYPAAESMAGASAEEIAELIYPVGMYNQKARTLIRIAALIIDRYQGRAPSEIEELLQLPGVGRKTANLVRSFAFHLPALCVDTHVHRISNRWGLIRSATPDQSEVELRRILPSEYWIETNAMLVQHGQRICRPERPECRICGLAEICLYPELQQEQAILSAIPGAPPHPCLTRLRRKN